MEKVNKIAVYLNRHINGTVYERDSILEAYSTDASCLKIKPQFVAVPETITDIRKLLKFVSQLEEKNYSLPIAIRGSGLCKTGADLSSGLVISMEHMDRIREIDAHDRLIHVEGGVTLGKLNSALAPFGLHLPISADPRETIGSLISNCPRDKYSGKTGGIMNFVDRLECVLASGELMISERLNERKFQQKTAGRTEEANIYRQINKIYEENEDTVKATPEHVRYGYPAFKHVKRNKNNTFDIMPIFFGAEASLGVITEVILRVKVIPPRNHRIFAVFNTYKSAAEFAEFVASRQPYHLDIYDSRIFKACEEYGKKPDLLTRKFDEGYVVFAGFNDKTRKARKKIEECKKFLPKSAYAVSETLKNSIDFDDFESCFSIYLNDSSKTDRPCIITDFYVPKTSMHDFLLDLKELEKKFKKDLHIFGNYQIDNYSIRPSFKLSEIDERKAAVTLLRDFNNLLLKHNGHLAGGMPEGKLTSIVLYPTLEEKERIIATKIKDIFDPKHIISPEIKQNYDTRSTIRRLRVENKLGIVS